MDIGNWREGDMRDGQNIISGRMQEEERIVKALVKTHFGS